MLGGKIVLTLNKLPIGSSGYIIAVNGSGALRHRLLDMGLTPHTLVKVHKAAPLGDPIELELRGYSLTIRLEDAANIEMQINTNTKNGGDANA